MTKTVGFLVWLSKTIKLGFYFFLTKYQNFDKIHGDKMYKKFDFTYNTKFAGLYRVVIEKFF